MPDHISILVESVPSSEDTAEDGCRSYYGSVGGDIRNIWDLNCESHGHRSSIYWRGIQEFPGEERHRAQEMFPISSKLTGCTEGKRCRRKQDQKLGLTKSKRLGDDEERE